VIDKINGMNQWTQENVKFKTTINQWHPDTATQLQQSLGGVACRIAVVEGFFLVITTINQRHRLP